MKSANSNFPNLYKIYKNMNPQKPECLTAQTTSANNMRSYIVVLS